MQKENVKAFAAISIISNVIKHFIISTFKGNHNLDSLKIGDYFVHASLVTTDKCKVGLMFTFCKDSLIAYANLQFSLVRGSEKNL